MGSSSPRRASKTTENREPQGEGSLCNHDITFRFDHRVLGKTVMDKLDASSTSIWEDLFPYRMSLIEEKLSPPGGYREMSLEEGYMGRVSIWNDTYDFFKEVVTYQEGGLVCPISDV